MTGNQNTKIVFLDCDGVISPMSGPLFSKEHMARLKTILNETGAKIVLSSSWRVSPFGRGEVTKHLVAHGMPTFIDVTPEFPHEPRAVEILSWLEDNKEKYCIVNFVALDDIALAHTAPDQAFFSKHAVRTDSIKGISDADVRKAIALLADENNF